MKRWLICQTLTALMKIKMTVNILRVTTNRTIFSVPLHTSGISVHSANSVSSNDSAETVFVRTEFIRGQRANQELLYVHDNEQMYMRQHNLRHRVQYQCRLAKQMCKAKLYIDNVGGRCYETIGVSQHNHGSARQDFLGLPFGRLYECRCYYELSIWPI